MEASTDSLYYRYILSSLGECVGVAARVVGGGWWVTDDRFLVVSLSDKYIVYS